MRTIKVESLLTPCGLTVYSMLNGRESIEA